MRPEDSQPTDFPRPHGVKLAEKQRMTTEVSMGPVVLGRNDNGAERYKIGLFWLRCHELKLETVMIRDERGPEPTVTVIARVPASSGRNVWA